MRIKTKKITPISLFTQCDTISAEDVKKNKAEIQHYILSSRDHLESLKTKIYKTIDASAADASVYHIDGAPDDDGVDYTSKPSEFLAKAYATETFDEQGEGITNRHQAYITAGTAFDTYCKKQTGALDPDVALCDDAGQMIAAINAVLSMLNKIEAKLIKAQTDPDEYEIVGGLAPQMPLYINLALEVADKSKIIKLIPEQTIVEQALSGLADLVRHMKKFFAHLGKSEDEIYNQRAERVKEQYDGEMTKDGMNNKPDKPAP